jgi:hypothetical protein
MCFCGLVQSGFTENEKEEHLFLDEKCLLSGKMFHRICCTVAFLRLGKKRTFAFCQKMRKLGCLNCQNILYL